MKRVLYLAALTLALGACEEKPIPRMVRLTTVTLYYNRIL